jgi:hypothetical protein
MTRTSHKRVKTNTKSDKSDLYEVTRIVGEFRSRDGRRRFMVHWAGTDARGAPWPPSVIDEDDLGWPRVALHAWEALKRRERLNREWQRAHEELLALKWEFTKVKRECLRRRFADVSSICA